MKAFEQQTRRGIAVAAVGIACNVLLSAAKITVGILLGLISVAADGFNNLGDCGSGVVSLVSACVAAKPADKHHPYGHRRAEYVAAMIIGFLVLSVAVGLLGEAIHKIIDGTLTHANWVVYTLLGASVAVKAGMLVMYRLAGGGSETLKAAATDSLCDCIATAAVALGAILSELGIAADGWAGIAVALFISWQGVRIVREASSELLGSAPNAEQANRIKALILSFTGVLGVHDLRIFTYGKGVSYATVHVEMDSNLPALQSHAVLDEIERTVLCEEGVELTAHLDPVDLNDAEAHRIEQAVRSAVEQSCPQGVELHDFRVIRGAVDKLVFDAGVPFECKLSDEQIAESIRAAVRTLGDYSVSVTVERE